MLWKSLVAYPLKGGELEKKERSASSVRDVGDCHANIFQPCHPAPSFMLGSTYICSVVHFVFSRSFFFYILPGHLDDQQMRTTAYTTDDDDLAGCKCSLILFLTVTAPPVWVCVCLFHILDDDDDARITRTNLHSFTLPLLDLSVPGNTFPAASPSHGDRANQQHTTHIILESALLSDSNKYVCVCVVWCLSVLVYTLSCCSLNKGERKRLKGEST